MNLKRRSMRNALGNTMNRRRAIVTGAAALAASALAPLKSVATVCPRYDRDKRFSAILSMKATDQERVAAYIELCRDDWNELAEAHKHMRIQAPDGSLHEMPPMRPFPFPEVKDTA